MGLGNTYWTKVERFCLAPATILLVFSVAGLTVNLWCYSHGWGFEQTLYASGIIAFVFCHVLLTLFLRVFAKWDGLSWDRDRIIYCPKFIRQSYWLLALAGGVLSANYMRSVGLSGTGSFFFNLRFANTVQGATPKILAYLSLFPFALALYYAYKRQTGKALLALSLSLPATLAAAERTGLLMKIGAVVYVMAWVEGLKIRRLAVMSSGFLALVLMIAYGAGKAGGAGSDFFLLTYVGKGISAFEIWIAPSDLIACYQMVFGTLIGGSLDRLFSTDGCGLVSFAPDGEFNVYTYMAAPYLVYGSVGVVITMGILGALYSAIFRAAQLWGGFYIPMTAVLIYPLVMVFFDWQFSLTTNVYMAAILLPMYVKFRWKNVDPNPAEVGRSIEPAVASLVGTDNAEEKQIALVTD